MLRILHIENIAVIERADIEFGGGLNVLTGETGAGKSIVIDALNAVTGARASKELVRTGAQAASVTAEFTADSAGAWCADNGIEPDDDGGLFLQRRITADGKNSCRINGVPVSVAQLRELGSLLLDVHGQNDGRRLLDESLHREYLDVCGGLGSALNEYRQKYDEMREKRRERDELTMDEGAKERRIDELRHQIDELERAAIRPGETDELNQRRELLKNASKLTGAVESAFTALYGGEDSDGASALISEAESSVGSAARYSEALGNLSGRLRELRISADDIAEELREFRESLAFSPQELDELEARLDVLRRLGRKYGGGEEELLKYLQSCRDELERIELSADRLIFIERELSQSEASALSAARKLSELRRSAAEKLAAKVTEQLSQLSMKGTRFKVDITTNNSADELTQYGLDTVRFLISANAGETPGRIARIASGGELSRIMLAMKNVLSEGEPAGTLVFDEVDAGVSGIAAQRVGEKLCDLASSKQVLCVTHLPQIAAMADRHYEIQKSVKNDRTYTYVNQLDEDGRKLELARLTGGENVTLTTLASAAELIESAQSYKRSRA